MKFGNYFIILGMLLPTASGADEAQTNFDSATTGAPAQTAPTLTQTAAGVQSTESLAVSDVNYSLVPRKPELNFFPCSMCHQFLEPNPEQRVLNSPHPSVLEHGGGRYWCLTCHDLEDRDQLRSIDGALLDFDNAPELCATCHMARYRDWQGGAHGKRVGTWQGERIIAACPQCHNPHSPTIKARAPQPPPPVRRDLTRPQVDEHGAKPVWLRQQQEINHE